MASYQIISSAGADMGIYEGATAREAVEAMCADVGHRGTDADFAELTVREMTAAAFVKLGAAALDLLAPGGTAVAGVEIEQDWDAETTTVSFSDGSRLRFSGPDVEAL